MKLLLVGGSLRTGSVNAAALNTVQATAPAGVEAQVYAGLGALPPFNPDDDHAPLPPAVADLRARIAWADALLISTPEYAGGLPGAFKNLLDWTVGSTVMTGRRVGWVNTAGPASPTGGHAAHASLRSALDYVNARIVPDACVDVPVPRSALGPDGLIHDIERRAQLLDAVHALARAPQETP